MTLVDLAEQPDLLSELLDVAFGWDEHGQPQLVGDCFLEACNLLVIVVASQPQTPSGSSGASVARRAATSWLSRYGTFATPLVVQTSPKAAEGLLASDLPVGGI